MLLFIAILLIIIAVLVSYIVYDKKEKKVSDEITVNLPNSPEGLFGKYSDMWENTMPHSGACATQVRIV